MCEKTAQGDFPARQRPITHSLTGSPDVESAKLGIASYSPEPAPEGG